MPTCRVGLVAARLAIGWGKAAPDVGDDENFAYRRIADAGKVEEPQQLFSGDMGGLGRVGTVGGADEDGDPIPSLAPIGDENTEFVGCLSPRSGRGTGRIS